jgi:hypothetical protein
VAEARDGAVRLSALPGRLNSLLVTARVRPASVPVLRAALERGQLLRPDEPGPGSHEAFLAEDQLLLLLTGPEAEADATRLLEADPAGIGALATHLDGPARLWTETFAGERGPPLDGVAFGPLPGPGNSEGGPAV